MTETRWDTKRRDVTLDALRTNMRHAVLGCEEEVEFLLIGLLAQGHVLIQGAPGMGKTSLAKTMAASMSCRFKRIQFTPDLLPADILGYSVFDQGEGAFKFHHGAVFTNILLADEINRTTPRIQSALLEAMNESQVSIDGKTYELESPFFVVATQNHLYSGGTFPLPDSQLDRFLISFEMTRPKFETQVEILKLHWVEGEPSKSVNEAVSKQDILDAQARVRQVAVEEPVMHYIAKLADATNDTQSFSNGVSARAALSLMRASQAAAWIEGRTHVYPDDVKRLMPRVFEHRLSMRHRFRKVGGSIADGLKAILETVPAP